MSGTRESLIVLADSQESTRAISDRTTIVNQPGRLANTTLGIVYRFWPEVTAGPRVTSVGGISECGTELGNRAGYERLAGSGLANCSGKEPLAVIISIRTIDRFIPFCGPSGGSGAPTRPPGGSGLSTASRPRRRTAWSARAGSGPSAAGPTMAT